MHSNNPLPSLTLINLPNNLADDLPRVGVNPLKKPVTPSCSNIRFASAVGLLVLFCAEHPCQPGFVSGCSQLAIATTTTVVAG
jgi:hypothetical protein